MVIEDYNMKNEKMPIDWEQIAHKVGSTLNGNTERSDDNMARRAIKILIGEENFKDAVDHYVSNKQGAEIVRAVLWNLRPYSAMERCYEIFKNSSGIEDRRTAVELLKVVADKRALPWVVTILNDPDITIQNWGAGLVDQLIWSEMVTPKDCRKELELMSKHKNKKVVETYQQLKNEGLLEE